jgi:hypothetical protein
VLALALLVGACVVALPYVQTSAPIHATRPTDCVGIAAKLLHTPRAVDQCAVVQLRRVVRREGVPGGLITVQRMANHNPLLKTQCHLAMHAIGQEFFREGRLALANVPTVLPKDANYNSSCPGGFLHGYMQGAVGEGGLDADGLVAFNAAACMKMDDQDMRGCAHSVGHGFTRAAHNELRLATTNCTHLPHRAVKDCMSGAVMEMNLADARVKARERYDRTLARKSTVDCSQVPASQRRWCGVLKVKGDGLVKFWGSGM